MDEHCRSLWNSCQDKKHPPQPHQRTMKKIKETFFSWHGTMWEQGWAQTTGTSFLSNWGYEVQLDLVPAQADEAKTSTSLVCSQKCADCCDLLWVETFPSIAVTWRICRTILAKRKFGHNSQREGRNRAAWSSRTSCNSRVCEWTQAYVCLLLINRGWRKSSIMRQK